jgi:hypothetical protein
MVRISGHIVWSTKTWNVRSNLVKSFVIKIRVVNLASKLCDRGFIYIVRHNILQTRVLHGMNILLCNTTVYSITGVKVEHMTMVARQMQTRCLHSCVFNTAQVGNWLRCVTCQKSEDLKHTEAAE